MPAIGYVTKQSDGSYKGELKTLSIRTALEIRPNPDKQNDKQPDYRVVANQNIEIGAAWANRDGEGFSIKLDVVPMDGHIVMRAPKAKDGGQQ